MVTPAIGTLPLRTAAAWIGGGARRSCPGGHARHAVDVQRDCHGLPIKCARYESHEGEPPMAIRWRLEREIPAAWLPGCCLAW
jgi:hypothetical protein